MALNETKHAGEFILSEANGTRSREKIVVATGSGVLYPGQLLGKVTASGKYAVYNNAASDGTQAVAGVLYSRVDATSADQAAVAIVRDAELAETLLTGLDTAGRADLVALGLILRA